MKWADYFLPIPNATRYEISGAGIIRNVKTGKVIKWRHLPCGTKQTNLINDDGKKIIVTLPYLLWLIHGKIIAKKMPVAVSADKGTRHLRFDTLTACAKFLATVTHLKIGGAYYHLARRHTLIADWHIHYFKY